MCIERIVGINSANVEKFRKLHLPFCKKSLPRIHSPFINLGKRDPGVVVRKCEEYRVFNANDQSTRPQPAQSEEEEEEITSSPKVPTEAWGLPTS